MLTLCINRDNPVTTRDTAGNVVKQSDTGQREMGYLYAVNDSCTVTTVESNGEHCPYKWLQAAAGARNTLHAWLHFYP